MYGHGDKAPCILNLEIRQDVSGQLNTPAAGASQDLLNKRKIFVSHAQDLSANVLRPFVQSLHHLAKTAGLQQVRITMWASWDIR